MKKGGRILRKRAKKSQPRLTTRCWRRKRTTDSPFSWVSKQIWRGKVRKLAKSELRPAGLMVCLSCSTDWRNDGEIGLEDD